MMARGSAVVDGSYPFRQITKEIAAGSCDMMWTGRGHLLKRPGLVPAKIVQGEGDVAGLTKCYSSAAVALLQILSSMLIM